MHEELGIADDIPAPDLPNNEDMLARNDLQGYLTTQMNSVKEMSTGNSHATQSDPYPINAVVKQEPNVTYKPEMRVEPKGEELEATYSTLNPFASTFVIKPKQEVSSASDHLNVRSQNPFSPLSPQNLFEDEETAFTVSPVNFDSTLSVSPSPQEGNPSVHAPVNDPIIKLVDLLSQRQERDHLPKQEPETFNGDSLNFPIWMRSFETLVEKRTNIPSEKIYYLGKYTRGAAKEAISGFLALDTEDAYYQAKETLTSRFGSPFLVSDAYRRRINEWPKIPPHDGPGLRRFADFLDSCKAAMQEVEYLSVLNDPDENQRMLKKLPNYLFAQWGRVVDKHIENEDIERKEGRDPKKGRYPSFAEFCKFLEKEARIACNPVTSLRALRDVGRKEDVGRRRKVV